MLKRVVCLLLIAVLLIGMVGCARQSNISEEMASAEPEWSWWIVWVILLLFFDFFLTGVLYNSVEEKMKKKYGKRKAYKNAKIYATIIFVIFIIICIFLGKWCEKDKRETFEALPVCQKQGHEYVSQPKDDLIESYELMEGLDQDNYYEGSIQGEMKGDGLLFGFVGVTETSGEVNGKLTITKVYRVLGKISDNRYKEMEFSKASTEFEPLKEGEIPYVEIRERYKGWKQCSVCGKTEADSKEKYYVLHLPKEIIRELLRIN